MLSTVPQPQKMARAKAKVVGKAEKHPGSVKPAKFRRDTALHGLKQASARKALFASTSMRSLGEIAQVVEDLVPQETFQRCHVSSTKLVAAMKGPLVGSRAASPLRRQKVTSRDPHLPPSAGGARAGRRRATSPQHVEGQVRSRPRG